MPTEYLLLATNSTTFQDFTITWVLNTQLLELQKLEESLTFTIETIDSRQWNHALWANNHYQTKSFSLGDHVL